MENEIVELNVENFDDAINNDELTVVDFYANWCMPCRMLRPILEEIADELPNIKFFSVNIDDSEDIAKRYRIFSIPTIVCFKSGKKIDSMVGRNPHDEIVEFITNANETKMD